MTLKSARSISMILVVLVCAAACLAENGMPPARPGMAPPGMMTPFVKDNNVPSDTNTVIISYGPEKLTLKEILYFVPEARSEYIKRMADQWLDLQLLYDAAKRKGITDDPKTKLMADLNAKQAFAREVMTKVANDVNVSDAQLLEYYEKNKAGDPQLSEPDRFSFTHIRVKTAAEANAVVARLKKGDDPSKVAQELSIAPDAKSGGAVKKTPERALERQYGADFAKALDGAAEGQVIGPIASNGEFEVARHEGKLSAKAIPFEQVKGMIKSRLEQSSKGQASQKYLESLRQDAKSSIVKSEFLLKQEAADAAKSAMEPKLPVDKSMPRPDNKVQMK